LSSGRGWEGEEGKEGKEGEEGGGLPYKKERGGRLNS